MMDAPSDVQDFLATRPRSAYIANLFTFTLLSGPVYRFTHWRRPNRALYTMDRVLAPLGNPGAPAWTSSFNRFTGRLNSIDAITRTSAEMTIKSMMDDLDNPYPRSVIQADCDAVLYDVRCGVGSAPFTTAAVAAAGCTKNTLLSGLANPDVWFTQGFVTFTSGAMSGISYMVKSYAGGVITPAYPFLVAPSAGDTFNAFAGCDKTLATCISKFGYSPAAEVAPFHRGKPFVPDPTVTY
jgi:uncharacterized phage protein (TIGR02218 family)